MRVLLVGEESAGMQMLRWLHSGPHDLVGIVTSPPRAEDTGVSMWKVAQRLGIATWPGESVTDPAFAQVVREQDVDVLLNVHSLHILCGEVLRAASIGAFNMHPGPLPEYAGLNSASWAIYHGCDDFGVTIHHMDPGIDTGDIAYQARFELEPTDTALAANARCVRRGLELMEHLLEDASTNRVPRIAQDLQRRGYYGRRVPEQGRISWYRTADEVVRFVRACDYVPFASPWGHPRAFVGNREIGIAKAHTTGKPCAATPGTVGEVTADGVLVACCDAWVTVELLRIDNAFVDARKVLQLGQRLADGWTERHAV